MKLEILFQDDRLVAIHKPAGLLVHRTAIAEESSYALQRLRNQLRRRVYPVHRLDRPTSGVLLFALDPEAAAACGRLFEARQVEKRYLLVARGYTAEEGVIDYPLREEPDREPQEAVTAYRRLAAVELDIPVGRYPRARFSLVEARPLTGRMHQIRRHFAHIFHPIAGDTTHGEGRQNRIFRDHFDCRRLLLHAASLEFRHPFEGTPLTIRAPVGPELSRLFERLGWRSEP